MLGGEGRRWKDNGLRVVRARRAREGPSDKVGGSGAVSRNGHSDNFVLAREMGFGICLSLEHRRQ